MDILHEMEQRNKVRFKCANCNFVFDVDTAQEEIKEVYCPHCNSNACDREVKIMKTEQERRIEQKWEKRMFDNMADIVRNHRKILEMERANEREEA